jgi:hypothetical protein
MTTTRIRRRTARALLAGAAVAATVTLASPAGAAPSAAGSSSAGKARATSDVSRIMIRVFEAPDEGASMTAHLDAVTLPSLDGASKEPAYIKVKFQPESIRYERGGGSRTAR